MTMAGANAASADSSPSNSGSLVLRLISVVILIPLIIAAAWWPWTTAGLAALCAALAIIELFDLLRQGGFAPRRVPGITLGVAFCLAAALQPFTELSLSGMVLAFGLMGTLVYEFTQSDRSTSLQNWALTFSGAAYIGWLLSAFILLRQLDVPLQGGLLAPLNIPPGTAWVFLVLAITWFQDSTAFVVGRSFGRTRMAPILSPKKTWEGFAGGLAASILVAALAVPLLGLPISLVNAILIGAAAGIAGPLGDLGESLIKRQIGVKDSGTLIPGHGGILDRMDSLLFTGPVVYYSLLLTLTP